MADNPARQKALGYSGAAALIIVGADGSPVSLGGAASSAPAGTNPAGQKYLGFRGAFAAVAVDGAGVPIDWSSVGSAGDVAALEARVDLLETWQVQVNFDIGELQTEQGVQDGRLDALEALVDQDVSAGASPTFGGLTVSGTTPEQTFIETDATTGNSVWSWRVSGESFHGTVWNDAHNSGTDWILVERTGNTIDRIAFTATLYDFYAAPKVSGQALAIGNGQNVRTTDDVQFQTIKARKDATGADNQAAVIQNRNATGIASLNFITGLFDLADNRLAAIRSSGGGSPTIEFWQSNGASPTRTGYFAAGGTGFVLGSPTGGAKGAGTINTAGLIYVNNEALAIGGGQNVRTTDSPTFTNLALNGDLTFGSGYKTINIQTGNGRGRVQGRYNVGSGANDRLFLSCNFARDLSGSGGTVDYSALGTAEVALVGRNAGQGGIEFWTGAVNTAPDIRAFIGLGLVMNGATGGDLGAGTINAIAVYDDGVLLTCGPLHMDVPEAMSPEFWDNLAVQAPIYDEIEQTVKHTDDQWWDKVAKVASLGLYKGKKFVETKETVRVVTGYMQGKHRTMRRFFRMVDEGFDPRDPRNFVARMRADRAVPGLPTLEEWIERTGITPVGEDPGPMSDKVSSGEMLGRMNLALDNLAVSFASVVDELDAKDTRIAQLEDQSGQDAIAIASLQQQLIDVLRRLDDLESSNAEKV